jgi:hypothetical protein
MLSHDVAGEETGIVKDLSGQYLAMGHVITGLSGGLHRNKSADIAPRWAVAAGEKMDNLYATTLAGDFGQTTVLANEEFLDRTLITPGTAGWRPNFVGPGTEATDAEVVGDIDGLVIGLAFEAADFRAKWDKTKCLSDFLLQYYTSSYKERFEKAAKLDTAYVQDQITRFAESYEYTQNRWTGAFKSVGAFSEMSYRAYQSWLASKIEPKTDTKLKTERTTKGAASQSGQPRRLDPWKL